MFKAHHHDLLRAVGARRGRYEKHTGHGENRGGCLSEVEPLEQRTLMSAFTFENFADRFNLPAELRNVQNPDSAVYERFGFSATGLGDIDADGFADFAIGAPGSEIGAQNPVLGAVFVFSGHTGTLLRTLSDGSAGFGFSLADIGDVNGDGVHDLLIGSPQHGGDDDMTPVLAGRAFVYSGSNGASLLTLGGAGAMNEFGYAVALIGDLNADGVNDFAVGAPGAGAGGEGQVTVFSGSDGAVIHTLTGDVAGSRFGAAVIGPGDLGVSIGDAGDGVGEILVGAPGSDAAPDFAGRVYLFNGGDGALRWSVSGESAGDAFGAALGVSYLSPTRAILYVGSPGYDVQSGDPALPDAGRVYRFEQDGTAPTPGAFWDGDVANGHLGARIVMVGDIDGDGSGDVAFEQPGAAEGARVRFVSGSSSSGAAIVAPASAAGLVGDHVYSVGDVDNDGFADFGSAFDAGANVRIVSSLAIVPPTGIDIVSGDLTHMFTNRAAGTRSFAVVNGQIVSFSHVPGLLDSDRVLGVNNAGEIVVQGDANDVTALYIIRGGVRTRLQDLVIATPTDPAPAFDAFQFVRIGEGGEILFMDSVDGGDAGMVVRSWLLRGQTLSYLWDGEVRDVNASGQILGVRVTGAARALVLRAADGSSEEIIGLADAWRVADDGTIFGVNDAGNLATWSNGAATEIGVVGVPEGATGEWIVLGVNPDGTVLARFIVTQPDPMTTTATDYIYTPGEGLSQLAGVTFDVDAGERLDGAFFIADDSTIVSSTGFFTRVADDAPWVAIDGTPLSASGGDGSVFVAGVNQYGDAVLLRQSGGSWHGWRINLAGLEVLDSLAVRDVLSFVNSSGRSYVFVLTDHGVYSGVVGETGAGLIDATPLDGGAGSTQIIDHATVFASGDHRVHLAGTNADGELVVYYQDEADGPAFFYENLTQNHIIAQGGTFFAVTGALQELTTTWGASHLFYLDPRGAVISVWIAPGMIYWASSDISASVVQGGVDENPSLALAGRITAYDTPWGGLNIAGSGVNGDPTAVWWAPGMAGTWRQDKLYDNQAQPPVAFDPASNTSYTTSWGGLNVASIDADTGDITVFWWVPGFDTWRAEVLQINQRPEGFGFAGTITSAVVGDTLNLFARGTDGDLYRIFWNPGDENMWNMENVTELV